MKKEFDINVFFDENGIELENIIEEYLVSIIKNENSYN